MMTRLHTPSGNQACVRAGLTPKFGARSMAQWSDAKRPPSLGARERTESESRKFSTISPTQPEMKRWPWIGCLRRKGLGTLCVH